MTKKMLLMVTPPKRGLLMMLLVVVLPRRAHDHPDRGFCWICWHRSLCCWDKRKIREGEKTVNEFERDQTKMCSFPSTRVWETHACDRRLPPRLRLPSPCVYSPHCSTLFTYAPDDSPASAQRCSISPMARVARKKMSAGDHEFASKQMPSQANAAAFRQKQIGSEIGDWKELSYFIFSLSLFLLECFGLIYTVNVHEGD